MATFGVGGDKRVFYARDDSMPWEIDKKHQNINLSHGIKIKSNVKLNSLRKCRSRILLTESD